MPFNEGQWGGGAGTGQRHTVTLLWNFLLRFSAFKLSYSFFILGAGLQKEPRCFIHSWLLTGVCGECVDTVTLSMGALI